jgi:hypothetical protein
VLFHATRPLLSETVTHGGTAYTALALQAVAGKGLNAYTVIDTTALAGTGADQPGTYSTFTFTNTVAATSGASGGYSGQWLTWNFPRLGHVTAPPGGVGAAIFLNGASEFLGTFQYGDPSQDNTPWYLDYVQATSTDVYAPGFWWLSPTVPAITANNADSAGITTRMGFLWQTVLSGGGTLPAVPSVATDWGTVTSAHLNGMGSALTLLNNPPSLRVSNAATQNVPASTQTVIQFPQVNLDNYAGWSTATSTYTAPLPGLYLFSNTVTWGTATSAGVRWSGLKVTAGGSAVTHQGPAYQAVPVGPGVSGIGLTGTAQARILALNPGDTVQCTAAQDSGITVATFGAPRLIGAYMTPQAAAGTVLSYTPPVTGFRFRAGAIGGTAATAALDARIGNDVNFLLNRPYFTGYQGTAQTGFPNSAGFHQITIDTVGALPRGGNGDNYGGWSAADNWYVSQVAGWYLVIADLYAVPPPAGTAGILTAGIFCSSSGGVTPTSTPDNYQQVYYPTRDTSPPGAFGMGLYYLQPGEYVYPMLSAASWGGTWGTEVAAGSTATIHSQFSAFFVSE